MATRAKFLCQSVRKFAKWNEPGTFLYESELSAVTGNSPENKQFFEASPSGSVKLSTVREDHFTPGKSYYVDFTEASD